MVGIGEINACLFYFRRNVVLLLATVCPHRSVSDCHKPSRPRLRSDSIWVESVDSWGLWMYGGYLSLWMGYNWVRQCWGVSLPDQSVLTITFLSFPSSSNIAQIPFWIWLYQLGSVDVSGMLVTSVIRDGGGRNAGSGMAMCREWVVIGSWILSLWSGLLDKDCL